MRKPKAPRLVTVAIFTTITIVFWIFFSLYKVLTASPPLTIPPEILEPISPELDSTTLEKLPGRVFFEQGEIQSPPLVVVEATPTPEEIPSEEITPTASPSSELLEVP